MVLNIVYALLGLSVIVSLFGIVNTLVLSVFERTRELGMLRAIGMTRRQVRRMIRHESVVTALIGATFGIGVGMTLAFLVTRMLADERAVVRACPYGSLGVFVARRDRRRDARRDPAGAARVEAERPERAPVRVATRPWRGRAPRPLRSAGRAGLSGRVRTLAQGGWAVARGALFRAGPGALVVRAGAAAGRPDEARARAAPLPREVRPAARRGLPRPLLRPGRHRLRPVRRLGDDARRGERARACTRSAATSPRSTACSRASRRRSYALGALELSLRVALETRAARATSDLWRRRRPGCASGTRRRRCRSSSATAPRRSGSSDDPAWDVARVVLSRAARSARLTTHFDLDFPPSAGRRRRTSATSTSARAGRSRRRRSSCAATRRTRSAASASSRRCGRSAKVEVLHDDARVVELPWRSTASSRRRRTRA